MVVACDEQNQLVHTHASKWIAGGCRGFKLRFLFISSQKVNDFSLLAQAMHGQEMQISLISKKTFKR